MSEKIRIAIDRPEAVSLQALAFLVLLSLPASARDPLHKLLGRPVPDYIGKWCPDDYCAKKEPCVTAPLCFGRDDYCSKKTPCVSAPLCFGCDDYRRKCPPNVFSRPQCQFLKCGTSCQPCGCATCAKKTPGSRPLVRTARVEKRVGTDNNDPSASRPIRAEPERIPPVIVRLPDFKLTK
jgi:hypothetical protein